jgi:hypothetical protein
MAVVGIVTFFGYLGWQEELMGIIAVTRNFPEPVCLPPVKTTATFQPVYHGASHSRLCFLVVSPAYEIAL